jgi:hypothetical protein
LFLGTPHQGGNDVRWGEILVNIASIFKHTSTNLIHHLQQNSEWLQQQLGQYLPLSGGFETKFGYETYKTPIALGKSVMVRLNPRLEEEFLGDIPKIVIQGGAFHCHWIPK